MQGKTIDDKIASLSSEIEEKQKQIKALQEKQKGLAAGNRFAIAEYLHEKECRSNHTDGCGFYYDSWKMPLSTTRKEWLNKADALLALAKRHALLLEVIMAIRHV